MVRTTNHKAKLVTAVFLLFAATSARADTSVLFIGNSFTFGWGSAARYYRSDTVTDLNHDGIGGMPALFKSFADQAGLDYDVYVETRPGAGIDYHLENKLGVIGRRGWDAVVMHGYSTLDPDAPRDASKLISTSRQMAEFLRTRNSDVAVYLLATWSRADQTYEADGAWAGEPIAAMAHDVRAAYDMAAVNANAEAVIPVGEAWLRAIDAGVADANPYDGIEPGMLDLWSYDHYHASIYGYYLEALVVFAALTGRDPRSLGETECSAFELGLSRPQVSALQQAAWEQVSRDYQIEAAPLQSSAAGDVQRCVA